MIRNYLYRARSYWLEIIRNPPVRACAMMALGLCFTFVGYEYARAASITLLAAEVSSNFAYLKFLLILFYRFTFIQ